MDAIWTPRNGARPHHLPSHLLFFAHLSSARVLLQKGSHQSFTVNASKFGASVNQTTVSASRHRLPPLGHHPHTSLVGWGWVQHLRIFARSYYCHHWHHHHQQLEFAAGSGQQGVGSPAIGWMSAIVCVRGGAEPIVLTGKPFPLVEAVVDWPPGFLCQ